MSKRRGRLTFSETDDFDARGLRRGPIPGAGVRMGRRAAVADLWIDRSGQPVVRFRTSDTRDCFLVSVRGGRMTNADWSDELGDRLADWLVDAMNDDLD